MTEDWIKHCVDEMDDTFALEGWSTYSAEIILRRHAQDFVRTNESIKTVECLHEWKAKERWKTVAARLAQRLRVKVESADDRWLVVRDREVLAEYDNLVKTL